MTIKTKLTIWLVVIILTLFGGVFYYLIYTGIIKIGADAIVGCQNSKLISSFFGSPGRNLTTYNFFDNEVSINEKLVPFLDKIQKEINDQKIDYDFNDVQTYNNRSKRYGGGKSLHSWAIALDINPTRNPMGGTSTDMPTEVIDIFKKHGFFWGGDWGGRDYDPMHFEWYGALIFGQALNGESKQVITEIATQIDGSGSPNTNGQYYWVVPYGEHEISTSARGYFDNKFKVSLTCFSQENIDISLAPIPSNVPGSIAGKIKVTGNYPILVPANIFLDEKLVGVSSLQGDYYIPNVNEGEHKVEAKVMIVPTGSTNVKVLPGDDIKNLNIIIGKK